MAKPFDAVKQLCKDLFESDKGTPEGFSQLLQYLLSSTVLAPGQSLTWDDNDGEGNAYISSRLRDKVFQLNNGQFLKFFMHFRFDRKTPLTIPKSCFQYQLDKQRHSKQFVFRYDYSVLSYANHPPAHLQINGKFNHASITNKQLSSIRFPVNRPSIESMLRFLINDFELKPNNSQWAQLLTYSEDAFHRYQAKKRLEEK